MRWPAVLVHAGRPMQTDSRESAGGEPHDYRITIRGEASQMFVDPLEGVVIESTVHESTLYCEAVDQAKLQALLGWLYARQVEILRVVPADGGLASADERLPKGQHDG
jgi:hypothetical protein